MTPKNKTENKCVGDIAVPEGSSIIIEKEFEDYKVSGIEERYPGNVRKTYHSKRCRGSCKCDHETFTMY